MAQFVPTPNAGGMRQIIAAITLHQLGDVTKLRKLMGFVPFGLAIVAILVSFLIRDALLRGPGWFTVYISIWVSLALTALSYYLI